MPAQKRSLADTSASTPKAKRSKISKLDLAAKSTPFTSTLNAEDVDFPRGGGTTFTPLEVKSLRAEAAKEADQELFKDATKKSKTGKRRKSENQPATGPGAGQKSTKTRIEHLNYKRIDVGMKIFGQIVSIHPLALIISLPNQLYGHVPITEISTQFTSALEHMEDSDRGSNSGDDDESMKNPMRDLFDLFHVGQYVRSVVTAVHAAGTTDSSGLSKLRDDVARASRRVELSLIPEKVNEGLLKADLKKGFTLTAAVKAIEDHGYTLDLGFADVAGFLSYKDISNEGTKLPIGSLIDVQVSKDFKSGRVCNLNADKKQASSVLTDISNSSSILPGSLVQCLVTEAQSDGLILQVLGFFDGTVDEFQLNNQIYKAGKKVQARILYSYSSSPPKFALSLAEHVIRLSVRFCGKETDSVPMTERYPIGAILQSAEVKSVEPERGLILEEDGQKGFVHISHVADDHVPALSSRSGAWKVGTSHQARVTGYFAFDGLLQLSLRPSVIAQKFMQVHELQPGEVIRGTIKNITDIGLFVSLSGSIDGLVKPNHYADIPLKHPMKRFKSGSTLKCKVLAVDASRKRVILTAKKTLLDSALPIITCFEEAVVGMVTYGVICRVFDKHILVEFYNHVKALVPAQELSKNLTEPIHTSFCEGRIVKVRIISIDVNRGRIIASIKQLTDDPSQPVSDISSVDIGDTVDGVVTDIHKDNAVLLLQPSRVRALVSLKNLANYRELSLIELHTRLQVQDKLSDLIIVSRNPEKSLVIVAHKPKSKAPIPAKNSTLTLESIVIGQVLVGRVTRHARSGTLIKFNGHLGGILHPADTSDNFEDSPDPYPAIDAIVKAAVVGIDQEKKQLTLSTRQSRLDPNSTATAVDREVFDVGNITEGETLRGYVKSIADHGLFVTIGRDIDARVQIRELFDEYIKDWKSRFKVKQLVEGRILKVDSQKKQVEMTFKSSIQKEAASLSLSNLSEGMKVDGFIRRIESYGLFVQIDGSKLSGLCHKSELTDNSDADVTSALDNFRVGDKVRAVITAMKDKKISFSLKASHFAAAEMDGDVDMEAGDEQDDSDDSDNRLFGIGNKHEEEDAPQSFSEDSEDDDDDDGEAVKMDVIPPAFTQSRSDLQADAPAPLVNLGNSFKWFGNDDQSDDDDASHLAEESDDEIKSSTRKKKRKEIEQDLTAEMHTKTPSSVADFERVLLGSPDSSFVWIQYMSFQLQLSEVEKARSIGRRALKTINFREEQEKLNVWIALLNLENTYGTDDSLDTTFKEAARSNESKTIHLRMAHIFDQSGKLEKAEEQFKRTCKKFGQSSKVWTLFAEYYLRHSETESARQLLPRSLQSLEKRKHLKTIAKFAQLEYKLGDAERGKTIFEGIVDSHSKRWDLWSVYMDMEAAEGDIESLRSLFRRVLALKMSSHKAKAFFKKWLSLEQRLGDEDGQNAVKQKAIEWTTASRPSEDS